MVWTIEKKVKELRANAAAKVEEAGSLLDGDMTAEKRERFDSLHAEAKKIGDDIARLEMQNAQAANFVQKMELPIDNKKEMRRYSLLKAINEVVATGRVTGLEKEVSDEMARKNGKEPQGFYIPGSLERYTDSFAGVDNVTGAGLIQTTVDAANFIEYLRAKTLLQNLGVRYIGDLVGNLALPKMQTGGSAYWVVDGSAPSSEAGEVTEQVVLTPNTLATYVDLSRKFIKQSSMDAEMFARDDLARAMAVELDRVAFNGSGTNNQPLGILQNSNVSIIPLGTNGAAPTFASMVELETVIAEHNADLGPLSYVTSPQGRGTLKTTAKIGSTYPVFLWEDDELNGCKAFASNQIPSNLTKGYGTGLSAVICGNFRDLVIGQWGGIDVLVDPYTGSNAGTVRVTMLADIDVEMRHTESFATIIDMIAS